MDLGQSRVASANPQTPKLSSSHSNRVAAPQSTAVGGALYRFLVAISAVKGSSAEN